VVEWAKVGNGSLGLRLAKEDIECDYPQKVEALVFASLFLIT